MPIPSEEGAAIVGQCQLEREIVNRMVPKCVHFGLVWHNSSYSGKLPTLYLVGELYDSCGVFIDMRRRLEKMAAKVVLRCAETFPCGSLDGLISTYMAML